MRVEVANISVHELDGLTPAGVKTNIDKLVAKVEELEQQQQGGPVMDLSITEQDIAIEVEGSATELDHLVKAVVHDIYTYLDEHEQPYNDSGGIDDAIEHLYNVYHDEHQAGRY